MKTQMWDKGNDSSRCSPRLSLPRTTSLVVVGLGSSLAGWPQGLCTQLLHLCVVSTIPQMNVEREKRNEKCPRCAERTLCA